MLDRAISPDHFRRFSGYRRTFPDDDAARGEPERHLNGGLTSRCFSDGFDRITKHRGANRSGENATNGRDTDSDRTALREYPTRGKIFLIRMEG